jgi:hypothetical protein
VRGQLERQVLGQGVQPGLGHRVGGRRGRRDGLQRPHAADADDRPAPASGDHAPGHRLGQEEQGAVEVEVAVVVVLVVLQERLRDEDPGRVDEQGGVRVLGGQLRPDPVQRPVGAQVGRDAHRRTVHGQLGHGALHPVLAAAHDDHRSSGPDHVPRDLPSDPAAAADDDELLPLERS